MGTNTNKYIRIRPPENYPGPLYQGKYALEHRVVWWENTGHCPTPDEDVHHKSPDTTDNAFENLELKTHAEHTIHHKTTGKTMVDLICPACKKEFTRQRRQTHFVKTNYSVTCCSRSCSAKYGHMKHKGLI